MEEAAWSFFCEPRLVEDEPREREEQRRGRGEENTRLSRAGACVSDLAKEPPIPPPYPILSTGIFHAASKRAYGLRGCCACDCERTNECAAPPPSSSTSIHQQQAQLHVRRVERLLLSRGGPYPIPPQSTRLIRPPFHFSYAQLL